MRLPAQLSCFTLSLLSVAWLPNAHAQLTVPNPSPSAPQNKPPAQAQTDAANLATETHITRRDARYIVNIGQANLAEIETAKLAQEKASNPAVKDFAKHMIDEHTKAMGDLNQLATKKSFMLPSEPSDKQKKQAEKLGKLSGEKFDREYIKRIGVEAHQETLDLLNKVLASGHDADLKNLADRMRPTVEKHLQMAKQLSGKK